MKTPNSLPPPLPVPLLNLFDSIAPSGLHRCTCYRNLAWCTFPPNTQLLGKLLASTYRRRKITLCKWQIKTQQLLIAEKSLKTCMFSGSGTPELHSSRPLLSYGAALPQEPAPVTWTGVSQSQRAQQKIPGCKYHWTTLKWAHFWLCLKHPLKG